MPSRAADVPTLQVQQFGDVIFVEAWKQGLDASFQLEFHLLFVDRYKAQEVHHLIVAYPEGG
jgi:hypothetical protein